MPEQTKHEHGPQAGGLRPETSWQLHLRCQDPPDYGIMELFGSSSMPWLRLWQTYS